MGDDLLFRLSGLAAMAGGLLRASSEFTAGLVEEHMLKLVYFATDFLLVFALMGIYLRERRALGVPGLVAHTVAVAGLLMVRSAELFGGYRTGAAVALLGTAALGLFLLLRTRVRIAPLLWLLALGLGLASAASVSLGWAGALAGVVFGLGFAAAGVALMQHPAREA